MKRILAGLTLALAGGCTPHVPSPGHPDTAMYLYDVPASRLAGTWYEVARYPAVFQQDCTHVTATYTPQGDGTLGVVNRCRRYGATEQITGTAAPDGVGQLKVKLEGVPFAGDYWILGRSRDGRTVYVGTPSRTAGWVLHRDRRFTEEQRRVAERLFRRNGYDEAALQRTDQR
ncbi:MAG: lipocalin family protein [Gemmobacter sp.]